jgi:hypothetical protein
VIHPMALSTELGLIAISLNEVSSPYAVDRWMATLQGSCYAAALSCYIENLQP